jgi:hypothetical protein
MKTLVFNPEPQTTAHSRGLFQSFGNGKIGNCTAQSCITSDYLFIYLMLFKDRLLNYVYM